MASNYIERPTNNYCTFCSKTYKVYENEKTKKNTHESRSKLFNQKSDITLGQRLANLNLIIEEDPELSSTICKNCESKIKKLEEAEAIKHQWSGKKRKIEYSVNDSEEGTAAAKRSRTEETDAENNDKEEQVWNCFSELFFCVKKINLLAEGTCFKSLRFCFFYHRKLL